MTDAERATIRDVIASMRERARLQIGQHEAIHKADIAKLDALIAPVTNDQQVEAKS
jgi:hypothetical protein